MLTDSINKLVIKNVTCDGKLHRWKTWKPNTPFAPQIDVHLYHDSISLSLTDKLIELICLQNIGEYRNGAWEKYNIFSIKNNSIDELKNIIWDSYLDYCESIEVEPYDRDYILIRGWAVRLDDKDEVGMHSHSLHENTFISGNISLTDNKTTTDYWIPLFSLYHGFYECDNIPGKMTLFPSWVQHRVVPNNSGKRRYSLAFDLFTKQSIDYVIETNTQETDSGKIILLSVPL